MGNDEASFRSLVPMRPVGLQWFLFIFILVVAGSILLTSIICIFQDPQWFAARKEQYELIVIQTLLPVFTAIATAVVAYILGKSLTIALRRPGNPGT